MLAHALLLALLAALSAPAAATPPPAAIAQWDFDGTLASSTGAPPLVLASAFKGGRPDATFDTVPLAGAPATVLTVQPGTTLRLRHGMLATGGGALLSAYTLIADLRVLPKTRRGFVALLQTHGLNVNNAEFGLDAKRGVGGLGVFGGRVSWDTWVRVAEVVDPAAGTATYYLDGAPVAVRQGVVPDGRDALEAEALLFADDDFEVGAVQLSSLRLVDAALPADALAALGGPTAAGPPLPPAPRLSLSLPPAAAPLRPGAPLALTWQLDPPHGQLALTLVRAGQPPRPLATVPAKRGRYTWTVGGDLAPGADYAIHARWQGAAGPVEATTAPFALAGAPPGPRAPVDLVRNGDFEAGLDPWRVVAGHAEVGSGRRKSPTGASLRGPKGDFEVAQDAPLAPLGLGADEVAAGLLCDASVALKAEEKPGRFDDQAWLRVSFLDAAGRELAATRTLPASGPDWRTYRATARVPGATATVRVAVIGRVRRGTRNDATADDVRVTLRPAQSAPPVAFTKPPLLYGPGVEQVTVLWETNTGAVDHRLRWREGDGAWRDSAPVEALQVDDEHSVQRAVLGPLRPGGRYSYVVESGDEAHGPYPFDGPPAADAPHRVAWVSDGQDGYAVFRDIVRRLRAADPALLIHAGDLVQHGMFLREWQQQWHGPLSEADFGQTTPVVLARGNHDAEHDLAHAFTALPSAGGWYAFTLGRVRYVVLNTEAHPIAAAAQTRWLEDELTGPAAREADFRIAVMHKPPYTNLWDSATYDGQDWVRRDWVPLFAAHGVDVVVSGHAHGYMRAEMGAQTYLVIGGAGGLLDKATSGQWEAQKVEATHHYVLMDAAPGELRFEVRRPDGSLLDAFSLSHRAALGDAGPEAVGQP